MDFDAEVAVSSIAETVAHTLSLLNAYTDAAPKLFAQMLSALLHTVRSNTRERHAPALNDARCGGGIVWPSML